MLGMALVIACAQPLVVGESALDDSQDGWAAPAPLVPTEFLCEDEFPYSYTITVDVAAEPGVAEPRFGVWSHYSVEYRSYVGPDSPQWHYNNGSGAFYDGGQLELYCTWMEMGDVFAFSIDRYVVLR